MTVSAQKAKKGSSAEKLDELRKLEAKVKAMGGASRLSPAVMRAFSSVLM